jgi:hypothetical protein
MESEQGAAGTRGVVTLAVLVALAASAAGVIHYHVNRHAFVLFGDAASHIVKARQLIDSQHPGIESIGTVWLPLPHFLLVPLVSIDALFFTGAAGCILGILSLVGTVVLIHMIVSRMTGSPIIAFVSACIFGLNPNIVYMALTPMNEIVFFFFVALSGYAFLRWREEWKNRWLFGSASSVMLATLCRYEAWVLALFVSLAVLFRLYSQRRQVGKKSVVSMILLALLPLAGILMWFAWNKFEFGDAFQFAPLKYRPGSSDINNPMRYRQEPVFLTLIRAVLNVFGPVVLLAAVAGVARMKRLTPERRHTALMVFLLLPALFITAGVLTDLVLIDQWWWNWRFVLVGGLFLSVACGMGLAEFFDRVESKISRGIALAALVAMPIVQLTVPTVSVATYEDAAKIFSGLTKDATAFGEQLGSIYKGGGIVLLTSSGLGERIMLSSSVPLKNFRVIRYPGGQDLRGPIRFGDRYVVIGKIPLPDSRETSRYWLSRRETLLQFYKIVLENEQFVLLERTTSR